MDENRDYRSEIGKKIEEALELGDFDVIEDLIEVPPMETFMKWAEQGEEKRKKRVRRKRTIFSCIAIVLIGASIILGIKCFAVPEVTADPVDDIKLELKDMESIETYDSWEELPAEVKEQFIEIKDLPDGYEVEEIEVVEGSFGTKLMHVIGNKKYSLTIRQSMNKDGSLPTSTVSNNNEEITINGIKVYVEENNQYETKMYKYTTKNIMIDVIVPNEIAEGSYAEDIIKTVQ